jgi:hypothetical protein
VRKRVSGVKYNDETRRPQWGGWSIMVSGQAVDRLALKVPILLLHRCSGGIAVEACRIDQYADCGGFQMVPAVFDGDVCVNYSSARTGWPPLNTYESASRRWSPRLRGEARCRGVSLEFDARFSTSVTRPAPFVGPCVSHRGGEFRGSGPPDVVGGAPGSGGPMMPIDQAFNEIRE